MTTSGATTSKKKRFWFDPRFAIGFGLIIASVAGVWFVVGAADRTVAVFAAAETLTAGEEITPRALTVSHVRLDTAEGQYLRETDIPEGGLVATRTVMKGELVPVSAVGDRSAVGVSAIVVDVRGSLAATVDVGASVDLWAAERIENAEFGPPTVIVSDATVVRLVEDDGIVSSQERTGVEILVPRGKVASVLAAIANADELSLVPSANG